MLNLDILATSLTLEIETLDQKYIAKYFPADPIQVPEIFEYDVKSYCLMAHAAFEEHSELISEYLVSKIESDFIAQKFTAATVVFLAYYGVKIPVENNEDAEQPTCFNIIRTGISESKLKHSSVLKDNHGFSLKYLRKILVPVGLDISENIITDSLKKLSRARGSFAHTTAKKAMYGDYKRATTILTPEESRNIVNDCLGICKIITEKAKNIK